MEKISFRPYGKVEYIRCRLCNGNAGSLSPDGAHYLCEALKAQGMPTPSLGDFCNRCNGTGRHGRRDTVLYNPRQSEIDAAFPPCGNCGGTGAVK